MENVKLLNKKQMGEVLQCSVRQIDYLREKAGLPFVKMGGVIRFDLDSVKQWIKSNEQQTERKTA